MDQMTTSELTLVALGHISKVELEMLEARYKLADGELGTFAGCIEHAMHELGHVLSVLTEIRLRLR
jgi:hypothetical protein